jgi:hypothetical protein
MAKEVPKGMMTVWEMIRAKHGYSMTEMADIIGVTKQCYSYWASGKTPLPAWMDMSKSESIEFHILRAEAGNLYHILDEQNYFHDK